MKRQTVTGCNPAALMSLAAFVSLMPTTFGTLVSAFTDHSVVGFGRSSAITRKLLSREPA